MQINNKDGKIMIFFIVILALIIGFVWYQYKNNPKIAQKFDNHNNSQKNSGIAGKLKVIKNAEDSVRRYNEAQQKSSKNLNNIMTKHNLGEKK